MIKTIPFARQVQFLLVFVATLLSACGAATGQDKDESRKLKNSYAPVYPEIAKQMRVSGRIVLKISVLPDGSVGEVHLESGHPLLGRAGEDAVRRWRYAAGPETTTAMVQLDFKL